MLKWDVFKYSNSRQVKKKNDILFFCQNITSMGKNWKLKYNKFGPNSPLIKNMHWEIFRKFIQANNMNEPK